MRSFPLFALALLLTFLSCVNQSGVPYDMRSWNRSFEPYRVIGNIYYVGSTGVAQFLIVTSVGNILIDSGFEASVPRLRENIERLGFRYGDTKLLLTSHAHIDHVQGHALVRQQTGAQVVVSTADATFVESGGKGEPVYDGVYSWPPCPVDRRVNDGDQITLGETTLTAHLTPGHTMGATTWTMKVVDHDNHDKLLDVVFFPSANINPGVKLAGNTRYPKIASDFAHSFKVWKSLPCDVFLACHGDFYDMQTKHAHLGATPNPFIDPQGYKTFIAEAEHRFHDQLASER
ncbi:MAG TPA: subclass B3 metallo-beta-lactamase [Polyangiaceae bacterium]|nr:subclass B3 metallo-beta-lactamase [Polyangiaceae bacterium]